jgi:hypothetical protein
LNEDIPVFRINLGKVDILLSAADFSALVAESDFKMKGGSENSPPLLQHKGAEYECAHLDRYVDGLFPPGLTVPPCGESVAFLARPPEGPPCAFILQRSFEMLAFSPAEFKLPPMGIRAQLKKRGIYAFRFADGERIQVLINFSASKSAVANGDAHERIHRR